MIKPVWPNSEPIPRIKAPIKASRAAVLRLFFILVLSLRPGWTLRRKRYLPRPKIGLCGPGPADPALPLEVDQLGHGGHDDEEPREPVAVAPRQLGNDAEVLAV